MAQLQPPAWRAVRQEALRGRAAAARRLLRPVLVAVLVISSLGLLGVSNGWLLMTAIAAIVILMVVFVRMRHNAQPAVGARASAKAA